MQGCTGDHLSSFKFSSNGKDFTLYRLHVSLEEVLRKELRIAISVCLTVSLAERRASHVLSVLAVNLPIAQCMVSTTISIEPGSSLNEDAPHVFIKFCTTANLTALSENQR